MLHTIALISLLVAGLCVVIIGIDILNGHRQKMWIMNYVWLLTPLYSGLMGLYAYYKLGRPMSHPPGQGDKQKDQAKSGQDGQQKDSKKSESGQGDQQPNQKKEDDKPQKPFWQSVVVGALHCGSGCTLGDIVVETFVLFVPFVLFGHAIFGAWVLDYIVAFLFGIAFQYFTIKPMKNLSPGEGLKAAVKADTLSLTAWQVGMYGWMAIATFVIFKQELKANDPVFWFMMQLAMLLGFLTAYPVNWWLIKKKIKEAM